MIELKFGIEHMMVNMDIGKQLVVVVEEDLVMLILDLKIKEEELFGKEELVQITGMFGLQVEKLVLLGILWVCSKMVENFVLNLAGVIMSVCILVMDIMEDGEEITDMMVEELIPDIILLIVVVLDIGKSSKLRDYHNMDITVLHYMVFMDDSLEQEMIKRQSINQDIEDTGLDSLMDGFGKDFSFIMFVVNISVSKQFGELGCPLIETVIWFNLQQDI